LLTRVYKETKIMKITLNHYKNNGNIYTITPLPHQGYEYIGKIDYYSPIELKLCSNLENDSWFETLEGERYWLTNQLGHPVLESVGNTIHLEKWEA
jgi:hypothetical protein